MPFSKAVASLRKFSILLKNTLTNKREKEKDNPCLFHQNMFSSADQYLTIGLRVQSQTPGWHESLTKVLKKIKGATYTIDAEQGMALVSGRANPKSILKKLKESGSDVAWIKTGKPNTYGSSNSGYYGSADPYLHHHYHGYHYTNYYDPYYVPNPPHFEPFNYWSTRYY